MFSTDINSRAYSKTHHVFSQHLEQTDKVNQSIYTELWTFSILNLRPKYHEPKGFYSVQSNCQIQSFKRCNVAFFAWACSWKAFALATGKRTISAEAKIYSASLSGTIFSALLHTKEEFVSQQHKIRRETLDALLQCGICAAHTFSGCTTLQMYSCRFW